MLKPFLYSLNEYFFVFTLPFGGKYLAKYEKIGTALRINLSLQIDAPLAADFNKAAGIVGNAATSLSDNTFSYSSSFDIDPGNAQQISKSVTTQLYIIQYTHQQEPTEGEI
jgi:hypothetical protein